MSTNDRQCGTLLGLAIGDALGAAVEFQSPGTFEEVADYRSGGPYGLGPGEWTDDTSMALALADSIGAVGWDINDQAARYVKWWRTGAYSVNGRCFDIGITIRSALSRFEQSGDGRCSGDPSERASGNGSIMRLAPVPIRYASLFPSQLDELIMHCLDSSLPTHASPQCLSACAHFGLLLAGMINGVDRNEALSPTWEPLSALQRLHPLHPEVAEVAAGSFRRKEPPEIVGSGYVVKSLEAALWAFHDAEDFRQAVLRAVNLGDDADTTGAVCGQLAGACWGESGVPKKWRDELAGKEIIEPILGKLLGESISTESRDNVPGRVRLAGEDSVPPTPLSYWVWDGMLLAGAYPGAATIEKHEQKIRTLIEAGIRTFVNLMEPDERDHQGRLFTPYEDVVRDMNSDAQCLRFPVRDLGTPADQEMTAILDTIDKSLNEEKPVYVHCWGGVGRTGTVIGCWLLRHGLATRETVFNVLAGLRQQDRERGGRESPETDGQRRFVSSWSKGPE